MKIKISLGLKDQLTLEELKGELLLKQQANAHLKVSILQCIFTNVVINVLL